MDTPTPKAKKKFGWKKWVFLAAVAAIFAYFISPELPTFVLKFAASLITLVALVYFGYQATKDSFFAPLPNQAAVIYRWGFGDKEGARTGTVLYEKDALPILNVCAKLPFVEKPKFYELKQVSMGFSASFMAKDDTELTVTGELFVVPDFSVLNASGIPVYGTVPEEDSKKQADAFAAEKLGSIGGSHNSDDFLKKRPTIGQILSEVFRLPRMAHLDHIPNDPDKCGLTACKFPNGDKIPVDRIAAFHKQHWSWINGILGDEVHHPEISPFEAANGVDVTSVKITNVALSAENKKAREEENRVKHLEAAFNRTLEMFEKMEKRVLGSTVQERTNVIAQVVHPGTTTRQISSFEGVTGNIGPLLGLVAAARVVASPSSSPIATASSAPAGAPSPGGGGKRRKGGRK